MLPALCGERLAGRRAPGSRDLWRRWAEFVTRHPWPALAASLAILLALSAPVLSLRLGSGDAGNDPRGTTTRAAYDLLVRGHDHGLRLRVVRAG